MDGCGLKSNSFKSFIEVLVTCKNEEDPFKNKGARVVTIDLSHCKSMQIFYDAKRKLTPQSMVGSTLN